MLALPALVTFTFRKLPTVADDAWPFSVLTPLPGLEVSGKKMLATGAEVTMGRVGLTEDADVPIPTEDTGMDWGEEVGTTKVL
jgi:hypothetical protein